MIKKQIEITEWLKNLEQQLKTILAEDDAAANKVIAKTNIPVPPNWKPSTKLEVLAWLSNLESQLQSVMTEDDTMINAKLDVAMKIIARIETLANAA